MPKYVPETSPYSDTKYIVIKREKFNDLFDSAAPNYLQALLRLIIDAYLNMLVNAESPSIETRQISNIFQRIFDRMSELQGNRYFCLNLDEKAAGAGIEAYFQETGYSKTTAQEIRRKMFKPWLGKRIVYKGKTITSGEIIEDWIHPETGKLVFTVLNTMGREDTVPIEWMVKEIKEEPKEEAGEGEISEIPKSAVGVAENPLAPKDVNNPEE